MRRPNSPRKDERCCELLLSLSHLHIFEIERRMLSASCNVPTNNNLPTSFFGAKFRPIFFVEQVPTEHAQFGAKHLTKFQLSFHPHPCWLGGGLGLEKKVMKKKKSKYFGHFDAFFCRRRKSGGGNRLFLCVFKKKRKRKP